MAIFLDADFTTGTSGNALAGFTDATGIVWADSAWSVSGGNAFRFGTVGGGVHALNTGASSGRVAAAYGNRLAPQSDYDLYGQIHIGSLSTPDDNAGIAGHTANPVSSGTAIVCDFVPDNSGNATVRFYQTGSGVTGSANVPGLAVGDKIWLRLNFAGGAATAYYTVSASWGSIESAVWTQISGTIALSSPLDAAGYAAISGYASGAGSTAVGLDKLKLLYTVPLPPADIAVDDPHLHFYGFRHNGATNVVATSGGAYLKGGFSGTSCRVKFDVTRLQAAGVAAGQWPRVRWCVDGGAWSAVYQLASADAVAHLITRSIAAGLAAGSHSFTLQAVGVDAYSDRWGGAGVLPVSAVIVTGIQLDNGGATVAPTLAAHRMGFDGDSILEGAWVDGVGGAGQYSALQEGPLSYAAGIAEAFGAEYDAWAQGGVTWDAGWGGSGVPAYYLADHSGCQENVYFGASKSFAGYDTWFVCLGANGTLSGPAPVTDALARLRALLGNATVIFVAVPIGGQNRAQVTAGFAAWTDAAGGGRAFLLDIGTQPGLAQYPTASAVSFDGLHPNAAKHGALAADFAAAMRAAISGGSGGEGGLSAPSLLTSAQRQAAQAAVAATLLSSAQIVRSGGVIATLPCRLNSGKHFSLAANATLRGRFQWVIRFAAGSDVRKNDLIQIGSAQFEVRDTDGGYPDGLSLLALAEQVGY